MKNQFKTFQPGRLLGYWVHSPALHKDFVTHIRAEFKIPIIIFRCQIYLPRRCVSNEWIRSRFVTVYNHNIAMHPACSGCAIQAGRYDSFLKDVYRCSLEYLLCKYSELFLLNTAARYTCIPAFAENTAIPFVCIQFRLDTEMCF